MLEKLPKPNMSVAKLPENGGKCKYIGLYPGGFIYNTLDYIQVGLSIIHWIISRWVYL